MSKVLDGSCAQAAQALALSPLATLGLKIALMILRRITFGHADRSLRVTIGSASLTIRVSKPRRSGVSRNREQKCMEEAGFISTGTIPPETAPLPQDVSSYLQQFGNGLQP